MALLNRFCSFLDRFDEQLVVNGERVKHEINQWIDHRVTLVRSEVGKMKARFGSNRPVMNGQRDRHAKGFDDDDPKVVTVLFEEFMQKQANMLRDGVDANQPSTSTDRKRKCTNQTGNIQKKTRSTGNSNQYACRFPGCGKSFLNDFNLAEHERIHLKIKPFTCTWANCAFSTEQRINVVQHIRTKHFRLPKTLKEQRRLNIVDNRDPEQYVQVDDHLSKRRLE